MMAADEISRRELLTTNADSGQFATERLGVSLLVTMATIHLCSRDGCSSSYGCSVASTAGVWLCCHESGTSLFEQMVA